MNTRCSLMGNNANVSNFYLLGSAKFKVYIVFVKIAGKVFCEFGSSLYGEQKYYDLDEFGRTNVIRRFATGDFGNGADSLWEVRRPFVSLGEGCFEAKGHIAHYVFDDMVMRDICTFMGSEVTPLTLVELEALGSVKADRTVANIYQIKNTGKYIYTINNVAYTEHFQVEWALNPMTVSLKIDGDERTWILGPGCSRNHCGNCNYFGSFRGVFLGYCGNCSRDYEYTRGNGFIEQGEELSDARQKEYFSYLRGVDITTLGYYNGAEEKYSTCLTGGKLPTGPDICDNQDDMDPVKEDEVDEYKETVSTSMINHTSQISKRYPRRAYSLPKFKYREVVSVDQTSEMTPNFVRDKMEIFLAENRIKITDNNYSFPIGPRPEWDHYRITKRPTWWFAWNAVLHSADIFGEDCELEIRLYVSNVHSAEHPAKMQLECNNIRGRSQTYWDMMRSLKLWILGETDSPLIVISLPVYEDVYHEDGELLSPAVPIY